MTKKLLKAVGIFAGIGALILAAAAVALKIFFPPEKVRTLIVDKAQAALHREVRLHDVSLGLFSGVSLNGLEISEAPDFKAGKFAGINSFTLKFKLAPLLHKKLVIDEIYVFKPLIAVKKDKKGKANYADLTAAAPAEAKKPAAAKPSAAEPAAFELAVRRAEVKAAEIGYDDLSAGRHVNLKLEDVIAKGFSYDAASGKLSAAIEKFAVFAAGLELDVTGHVKLDPKRLEVPDLKGKFDGQKLEVALTVDDYAGAADAKLKASLSQLDLGKLMAAKEATTAQGGEKSAASVAPAARAAGVESPSSAPAMKTSGEVVMGKLIYTGAEVKDTKLEWALSGITPDLRKLGGWAKLHSAGGSLAPEQKGASRTGIMKALMMPITVVQKIGAFILPLKILPDLTHIMFTEIAGDYVFDRGVMTIKDFHLDSATVGVKTTGTVDLAAQKLALVASIKPSGAGAVDVDVTGTFDNPSMKPRLGSVLASPAAAKIKDEAGKLLKGLFGH